MEFCQMIFLYLLRRSSGFSVRVYIVGADVLAVMLWEEKLPFDLRGNFKNGSIIYNQETSLCHRLFSPDMFHGFKRLKQIKKKSWFFLSSVLMLSIRNQ